MCETASRPQRSPPGRLTVLHVIAPSAFGGAESVVSALASGLVDRGHSVHAALILDTGAPDPPLLEQLRSAGVGVTALRLPPRGYLKERRSLIGLITSLEPDVVHTHGYRADVIGGLASRATRVPIVSTAHGEIPGGAKDRFFLRLQRGAYRRFDGVVAVSRPLAIRLEASLKGRTPIHIVPNAWEPSDVLLERAEARACLGLPDDAFVVGWVGRLSWEKGADVLVEAGTRLRDLDLSLCFIGDGPARPKLVQRARALDLDVCWPGAVPEAWRLFTAFDLFVLSSRTEGTPMVLFEAIHAGIPIVATAVGGVPDVVGKETAWLVPPEDPEALAAAMRRALTDQRERDERARAAASALSDLFDPADWLRRHERVYAGLVPSRAHAASDPE